MEPSAAHNPERADYAILETIKIATEGKDCDERVRKLRPVSLHRNKKYSVLSNRRLLLSQAMKGAEAPDQFAAIDSDDAAVRKTFL